MARARFSSRCFRNEHVQKKISYSYCNDLTSVTIGDSVTSIGDYAFNACDSLTDVYYAGDESGWEKITIGNYNSDLTEATIHYDFIPNKIKFSTEYKKVVVDSLNAYRNTQVLVACYADGGRLISLKQREVDINPGTNEILFNDFDLAGADTIKIFILDSITAINPFFKAFNGSL